MDLFSNKGAAIKVKTPAGVMDSSSPETVNVTSSPSASVAVTVPIASWFSGVSKTASEVKTGATSFTFVTLIVIP